MPLEPMSAVDAGAWGLLGGFIVEALEYSAAIRRAKGWPWRRRGEPGFGPQLVAVLLRLSASAGLAAGAGAGGQVSGVFGALVLGVTTPLVVEKILGQAGMAAVPEALPPKLPATAAVPEAPSPNLPSPAPPEPASAQQPASLRGGPSEAAGRPPRPRRSADGD